MQYFSTARIKRAWDALSSGYWFIPGGLSLLAALLFWLSYSIDISPDQLARLPEWFPHSEPASARAILTSILTTSISVVSLTFSITIVALTMASSQFGTHLLYNFMRDRSNQVVLGVFIANFVFALLTLRVVGDSELNSFVPQLSLQISIGMALLSTWFLIYFLHNIAESLQASSVLARLQQEISTVVRTYFPEPGVDEVQQSGESISFGDPTGRISAKSGGIVQVVDHAKLLEIAVEQDIKVRAFYRAGHYVLPGACILEVSGNQLGDDVLTELRSAIVFGSRRTHVQDIEFGLFQLVEIALRALSPGINDPNIAIMCINELGSALSLIMRREMPPGYLLDDKETRRVVLTTTNFDGVVGAAFNQIRQHSTGNTAVTIRLLEVLSDLAGQARLQSQLDVLQEHSLLCYEYCDVQNERDMEDVKKRFEAVGSLASQD